MSSGERGESGRRGRGDRRLRSLIGGESTLSLRDSRREGLTWVASLAKGFLGWSSHSADFGDFPAELVKAFGQGVVVVTRAIAVVEAFLVCAEDSSVELA